MENIDKDEIKNIINLKKYPEPLIPGLYKIDIVPNIDIKKHDNSIDDDFYKIHTLFTTFFPIDFLEEIRKLENNNVADSCLRKNEQIDNVYYRKQSDRNLIFKRAKEYLEINNLKNYQKDVAESFETINEELSSYVIEEEYPLFPNKNDTYVVVNKTFEEGDFFINKENQSSLIKACVVKEDNYNYMKQMSDDKIIIELKDGKAYYSNIKYFYKFK